MHLTRCVERKHEMFGSKVVGCVFDPQDSNSRPSMEIGQRFLQDGIEAAFDLQNEISDKALHPLPALSDAVTSYDMFHLMRL